MQQNRKFVDLVFGFTNLFKFVFGTF